MTNKDRLVSVLNGRVPDCPPHFELEFQLGKEVFELHLSRHAGEKLPYHARRVSPHFGVIVPYSVQTFPS